MRVIRDLKQMSLVSGKMRRNKKAIGLVPTMGALHAGHLGLIRQARRDNDIVVVSIFVNPAQFGPKEDFRNYPRPINKDIALCRKTGVDFIFHPDVLEMYGRGFKTYVNVEEISKVLCGRSRPGHFRGVTTIVAKLFNIVQPDVAYFGQKDAQQAIIIKRMTEDLNFPVRIKVIPTLREKDGLAMSSRNIYLNKKERKDASSLYQSLKLAEDLIRKGAKSTDRIIAAMMHLIKGKTSARIDYIAIVDLNNLKPIRRIFNGCLIALAVYIGKTRLMDNLILKNA